MNLHSATGIKRTAKDVINKAKSLQKLGIFIFVRWSACFFFMETELSFHSTSIFWLLIPPLKLWEENFLHSSILWHLACLHGWPLLLISPLIWGWPLHVMCTGICICPLVCAVVEFWELLWLTARVLYLNRNKNLDREGGVEIEQTNLPAPHCSLLCTLKCSS